MASATSGQSACRARTVTKVSIGEISATTAAVSVAAPRIEWASHVEADERGAAEQALHESRLSAVVEMIENLTGRQVKLVPPAAYFVSRPAPPVAAPVDVVVRADMASVSTSGSGPLVVDIHSILETGTANRMVLAGNATGGLDLSVAVDVEL